MLPEGSAVTALVIDRLGKNFGGLQALHDLSLEVQPGERRVILGPNGAGKTTLFNLIGGQLSPSSGRIFLFDHEVTKLPPFRRAALGLARTFQITTLFPNLTVLENMLLAVQALDSVKFVLYRPSPATSTSRARLRACSSSGTCGRNGTPWCASSPMA